MHPDFSLFDFTSCHLSLRNANIEKKNMHAIWELMQVMWEVEGEMLEDLTLVEVGGWRVGIPTESWRQQADFRGGVGIWTQTDALLNILRKEIINIFTQFAHSWSSQILKKNNVMIIMCIVCPTVSKGK